MDMAILLVDDEPTILDSLRTQLRNLYGERFDYETAESVDDAWEVLEELLADDCQVVVVVSDWLMPGRRGDEFLSEVRSHFPQIGRVMLTGHVEREALDRARSEGDHYPVLYKPWDIQALKTAIDQAAQDSD
ncbi:MAG: response regulator [Deltaproteobacteria bacterium]|nr:response regulator [Deltaproteobacteria bacterium]